MNRRLLLAAPSLLLPRLAAAQNFPSTGTVTAAPRSITAMPRFRK